MPYEQPALRSKRQEGGFYGRRFGYRELNAEETALHETVSVYRVKAHLGSRRTDSDGNTVDDYCQKDGPVEIKWTEWTWTKVKPGGGS
jgi:hypothetical protein